ncbi:hypothetical protein DE146DRAFT_774173 [Phaeosphaeria sp. MPI-PUGE-AT-0046c]|nr:hypothetical protein DE146DRAFT_774173 [Phaeosphaeria sp. MPI-PUGE-AT-0046c]
MSSTDSRATAVEKGNEYFTAILTTILNKLKTDPSTITTEDARRLSENVVAEDEQTAKIISAVEAFAAASEVIHEVNPQLVQAPHASLLTVVNDLKVAVEQNPADVTTEVLKTAQNIVSKMQRAIGHTNAPHPELEDELREEIARIEPKVAEGSVTIEEANQLHSLEARAHGHTERGGITSLAQSVAAKCEHQMSLSSGSNPNSNRSRANSKTFSSCERSHYDVSHQAENAPGPKVERGTAQPVVGKKRQGSLSDQTNSLKGCSTDDLKQDKGQPQHENEGTAKLGEMSLDTEVKNGLLAGDRVGSGKAEGSLPPHKSENSQPSVEVK